jgi:hypothetical protein
VTWLLSLVVAVISAALGIVVAGTVAAFAVDWYAISSFEGGAGYFVVFMGLFGGMAGFVIGLIASRVVATRPKPALWKGLAVSSAVIATIGGVTAGVARLLADVPPQLHGQTQFVQVELRWPEGKAPSPAMRSQKGTLTLGSVSGSVVRAREEGPLFTDRAALVDGRWVMPGDVRVFTERGQRILLFEIGETQLPSFALPLPAHPWDKHREWSEWLPATADASVADGFRYRFKIRLANEPLRVDRVGPFAIETRVGGYYSVMESDRLAASSTFVVRYQDAVVVGLNDAEAVSVIGGAVPALLVKADEQDRSGICHLVREEGGAAKVTPVGGCALPGSVSPLTSDQERFDAARRFSALPGWVDEQLFAQPGLYRVSQFILDTRTLTSQPFDYLSNYPPYGSVPPLALSPDERSFIVLTSDNQGSRPTLVAIDYRAGKGYPIAIDRSRIRFNEEKDLGPAWIAHHFSWQPSEDGDRLVERPGFVPLPHHGDLALGKPGEYQSYTLRPGGEPLRAAIIRILVERLGGERLPDVYNGYQQRVRLYGRELHVTTSESPAYVTVAIDAPDGDRDVMTRVATALDAIVGTGELDDLFVESAR